jgi:RNA polymerase subunit RPABC4/transcription elongation factor Spt4
VVWICKGCTARYAVGAPRCPQCQSTEYVEEGQDMPKVTVHGGPSIADEETVVDTEHGPELTPVTEAPAEYTEGSEESSPGSSSATSSEKEPTSGEPSGKSSASPARKTASRSK